MSRSYFVRLLACSAGLLAATACHAAGRTEADPLDPKAVVPPPAYAATLQQFHSFDDVSVTDWRKANQTVRDTGGWRAYGAMTQPATPEGGHEHAHQP